MGSWNGTCAVTQLPIHAGDNVVLFPLLKNEYAKEGGAGFSYTHNQYAPISTPLYGEYNDYGGIENVTKNGEFLFHLFGEAVKEGGMLSYKKSAYERQQKINKRFTGTPNDLEELIDVYLREPVYAKTGYMLVHEEIYHKLIDEVGSRISYREKKPKRDVLIEKANDFINELKVQLTTPIEELYHARKVLRAHPNRENKEIVQKRIEITRKISLHEGDYDLAFRHNEFVQYFIDLGKSSFMFGKLLLQTLIATPEEERTNLIQDYVDLILFDLALDLTRKFWTPQGGAGSQGYEMHLHKLIAETIIEKEKRAVERYFEENIAETEEEIAYGKNCTKESIL